MSITEKYLRFLHKRKVNNCFFTIEQLRQWEAEGCLVSCHVADSLIILRHLVEWNELYYIGDTWEWFMNIDVLKNYCPIRISITCKSTFDMSGVTIKSAYKKYIRLRRNRYDENVIKKNKIEFLEISDLPIVKKMMKETFDPLSDDVPTNHEMLQFIENKNVICERRDGVVVAFIIFEDKAKTSYVRMVCVDKGYRGCGIANRLLKQYLEIHKEYLGFSLWVDEKNEPAMALYKKNGYEEDRIVNYIYVLKE